MNDAFKKIGTSKGDRIKMFNSLFYQYLFINYGKCKYPMNPHVPLLLVGWSVDWMVGRYVIISFKVTEFTLPCTNRSTCLYIMLCVASSGPRLDAEMKDN